MKTNFFTSSFSPFYVSRAWLCIPSSLFMFSNVFVTVFYNFIFLHPKKKNILIHQNHFQLLRINQLDNNESEYFSETLAAEVLPHYQPPPASTPSESSKTPSQKSSPSSSVDATSNYVNNNGQPYPSMPPPPISTNNGNGKHQTQPSTQHNTNGNGILPRNSAPQSATGGMTTNQQMQQQLQQKYYDQYENYARSNGNYNGMSQSSYNSPQKSAAYAQMTSSYNQQMNYNNYYNNHQNNGIGKISDYDPISDGPRNIVPQAGRPNQTLIYSSDRAACE